MAKGEIIAASLTEADGGSDPASMRTNARKAPGGYSLNGSKMWITTPAIAEWPCLGQARRGVPASCRRAQGFRDAEDPQQISLRASVSGEIALDEVSCRRTRCCRTCPAARPVLLPEQGPLRHRLGRHGRRDFCLHASRDYTKTRSVFGKPWRPPADPRNADMQTEIALGFEGALALGG